MEERILVYKDEEYDKLIKRYQLMREDLQELVYGLKDLGIEPGTEIINKLLEGEDVQQMITEKNVSEFFGSFPRQMQKAMKEMFASESQEDYMEKVGRKAARLKAIKDRGGSGIDFSFFYVENGNVVLSPDHTKEAERLYCVFIDTPNRRIVYDKWLLLKEAVEQFETAVKNAPKKQGIINANGVSLTHPQLLQGLTYDGYSIATLYGGELYLNGYNFDVIL